MKTKTITKTFYVGLNDFHILKGDSNFTFPEMASKKTPEHEFQIQISWQESEKKIEITESEFDEAVFSFFKLDENNNSPISRGTKMQEHLKLKLFGNREV